MRAFIYSNSLWGILALGVFTALIAILYQAPEQDRDSWYLNAKFSSVGDLRVGADVMMSGLPVGNVESIRLTPDLEVLVQIKLIPNLEIPDDSDLRIQTSGLFGSPYLSLALGGGFDMLEDGDEFAFTQSNVDFLKLFAQIVDAKEQKHQASTLKN